MHRLRAPIYFAAALVLAGCGTSPSGETNPVIPSASTAAQLRPGDSLTISLQGIPDPVASVVQIDENGTISLPYIGKVGAAGLSTADLSERIRDAYVTKKFYTTLDVSASITERYVYVGGEVEKPGRILWTTDLTLAKAIQAAGGFTLYAKEDKVTVVRDQKAYLLNVKLAQRSPSEDPRLVPGDSLQVPRSSF